MHTIYILIALNRSQVNKNTINVPLWLKKRNIHLTRPQWANIISLAVSVINCAGLWISLELSTGTSWPWRVLSVVRCQRARYVKGLGQPWVRFPQKIFVYVTVLDIKSIYTQFLFSQVQVHISRDIGNSCEVDNFLRHLQSFLSCPSFYTQCSRPCFSTDTTCLPAWQCPSSPDHNTKTQISTIQLWAMFHQSLNLMCLHF